MIAFRQQDYKYNGDIDDIREPVLYRNNIIFGIGIPSSNAIGIHLYPIQEVASIDKGLYNSGPSQLVVLHFILASVVNDN